MSDAIEPIATHPSPERRDARTLLAESGLPQPARALVGRVVAMTRLWRSERADVAEELIAHFTDALAAGKSVEEVVASFGDERPAAALIRRAKIRNRSIWWKARRAVGWLLLAFIVLYVGAGIYFLLGQPSPSIDYVALINKAASATPKENRAWPIYRDALRRMKAPATDIPKAVFVDPDDSNWPEAVAWLTNHAEAIEQLRQAAAMPALGYVAGHYGDAAGWPLSSALPAAELAAHQAKRRQREASNPLKDAVAGVILPHLNELRAAANIVAADCRLARLQQDAARTQRNIVALLDMADQLARSHALLVTYLVASGIDALALMQIEQTLIETPNLLDDAALARLAHRIGDRRMAADLLHFQDERIMFYDLIQRMYTDDGHGDGRLTPQGIEIAQQLAAMYSSTGDRSADEGRLSPRVIAGGPLALTRSASRRELLDAYDELMDLASASLRLPLRLVDMDAIDHRLAELAASWSGSTRFADTNLLFPSLSSIWAQAERSLGRREGLVTAIALELYRRKTGGYPATLDELSPAYLPTVPADRITGEPIRYRFDPDGTPLLYSLGVDRDDDGGRPAVNGGLHEVAAAAEWSGPPIDGDWVLYPQDRRKHQP